MAENAKDWVFKDETGLPSQPPYSSLVKIMPNLVWDTRLSFPLNNSWGYHDAAAGNGKYDAYYEYMVKRYGALVSMYDFSDKMQLKNATGYHGTFEAAGRRLNDIGGIMLWKLNAAFPSVAWQVYGWYLAPNAGYYFMQNSCESVHIQLNPLNNGVSVLNMTGRTLSNLTAEADVFDMDSKLLSRQSGRVSLSGSDVKGCLSLSDVLTRSKGVNFVILNLKEAGGKVISHNTYWLAADNNYTAMQSMPRNEPETIILKKEPVKSETVWTVRFINNSNILAFFINPRLMNDTEEVLPAFWSTNYFTLAPGESIVVKVSANTALLNGNTQYLLVKGWNVEERQLTLK